MALETASTPPTPESIMMTHDIKQLDDRVRRINKLHAYAVEYAQTAIECAQMIGELLIEVKADLPHGVWGKWCDQSLDFSERTARNYMRIARELPKLDEANRQRVAGMSLRGALSTFAEATSRKPNIDASLDTETAIPGAEVETPDGDELEPQNDKFRIDGRSSRSAELTPVEQLRKLLEEANSFAGRALMRLAKLRDLMEQQGIEQIDAYTLNKLTRDVRDLASYLPESIDERSVFPTSLKFAELEASVKSRLHAMSGRNDDEDAS